MRISVRALGIVAVLMAVASTVVAAERGPLRKVLRGSVGKAVEAARSEDEKAIRHVVDSFVIAYNAHDAKAVAALFTLDAAVSGRDDQLIKGREAIEKTFVEVFKESPQVKISNTTESLHLIGPTKAVETGYTTTHDGKNAEAKERYRVVYTKQDGKWLMMSAIDLPEDAWAGEDEMNQLKDFIGHWVSESPEAVVFTSYQWTDNHRFIPGQFTIQIQGKPAMTGTHRIGWDPRSKTLHSWVFDSEGGFAEGDWSRVGDQWQIKLVGVTRDGKPCSVTETLTVLDQHRMTMQSLDRVVDNKKSPDGAKVTVVRRPPIPKIMVHVESKEADK
jgi:uncharacterized protein (TIGR02246 family)